LLLSAAGKFFTKKIVSLYLAARNSNALSFTFLDSTMKDTGRRHKLQALRMIENTGFLQEFEMLYPSHKMSNVYVL
jgi:hypothetical protein